MGEFRKDLVADGAPIENQTTLISPVLQLISGAPMNGMYFPGDGSGGYVDATAHLLTPGKGGDSSEDARTGASLSDIGVDEDSSEDEAAACGDEEASSEEEYASDQHEILNVDSSSAYSISRVREHREIWSSLPDTLKLELSEFSLSASQQGKKTASITSQMLKKYALRDQPELPGLRYLLEQSQRGRCSTETGLCECFPPFRGPACQYEDRSRRPKKKGFKAILHYLIDDTEGDVNDITYSLPRLWDRFNKWHDYDVVLFHDRMTEASRQRIVESSENRIWFAYVNDFKDVGKGVTNQRRLKARLKEVKWSVGYRGMCRFRSGTMFLQPVMKFYDYAMTLDTDGNESHLELA